jgi:phage head maturation protease
MRTYDEARGVTGFAGQLELQQQILAAHVDGDEGELRRLQREYRERAMRATRERVAARDGQRRAARMQPVRAALRGVVVGPEPPDPARQLVGYALTWDGTLGSDRRGRPIHERLTRDSLRGWLETVVPLEIPVHVDHAGHQVGRCIDFMVDDTGLLATLQVDQLVSAAVLDSVERGALTHLSAAYGIDERGVASVGEVSLCATPADPRAEIILVAGHLPRWQQRARSMELLGSLRRPTYA